MKMRILIALLFSILLASPALAMNELQGQPLSKVEEMGGAHGVIIEKLNDADTATMDAATNARPKPSTIYLLTLGSSVIIALVHEGVLIFSSDPVELERINKMLNRSGA
jgi:hypothetical protein